MKIYFRMMKAKPYWYLIIALALVKFVLPWLLQSPVYELQRDEYLYFQQGQHLDLGYLENPPLLSYLGTISGLLFGTTEFAVRIWAPLIGSITLIIACLIAVEFGGRLFAQFLTGAGLITGAFLRIHSLFQPNILDILFWTLTIYFLIRFIKSDDKKYFYGFALALALGIWSKYSIVFLIAALGLGLLMTRQRKIFANRFFYIAAGAFLIIILPNVIWQWQHRWPIIHHMRELQDEQLQFLSPGDFIKDQLLYLFPAVFIWIAGLIWLLKNRSWRFLFLSYFFVIIFLLLGRGKSYYAMGIYPVLLAAGAVAWENMTQRIAWARYAIVILIAALTIPFIPLLLPLWKPEKLAAFYKKYEVGKTGLLKWEDQQDHPLPQDFADMLGWRELAEKTEKFYNSLPDSSKNELLIYCRNYGQAGALKFYGRAKQFLAKSFSDNGSFSLWIPSRRFNHLILVDRTMPGQDDEVFQHFQKITVVDSVTNVYSRQFGDKIIYFQNIDSVGFKIARKGLEEMQNEFRR